MDLSSFARPALLLAALLLAPACGPADVEGRWEGEWHSSIWSGSLTLELTQDGDTFEGSFVLGGTGCVGDGDVSGTVDGHDFSATMRNKVGGEVHLEGNVGAANEKMDGDFEVTGGWCQDARGTFNLNKD